MNQMKPNKAPASNYWLDHVVADILKVCIDKDEIILSSGISPSASYHIGHFREILTADAITWGLRQAGKKVKHIHVVDNFDPLRKRYNFLPKEYEQYVGQPICLVPDPFVKCRDRHKTYAEHYYQEFEQYSKSMGIVPDQVVRSYEDLYKTGKMTLRFNEVLAKIDTIHKIFKEVSNRNLSSDWTPVQVLSDDNQFIDAKVDNWDKATKTINGKSYQDGHVKLNWRLDWPARWKILGVMVEPFSAQEHGAAGGSYETAVEFCRQVFKFKPPMPGVQYANIHLKGDTKKMSSSMGNLITPQQALDIMPPEILRYFVVRSRADKTLFFDSGEGLYNLIDEFSQIENNPESEFKEAYQFAKSLNNQKKAKIISTIPFKHLVMAYQAALKQSQEVLGILKRTGYREQAKGQKTVILSELKFIDNWLKKYAPESVKFAVQSKLPKVALTDGQKKFLAVLADKINNQSELQADWLHQAIYDLKGELMPNEAFRAIYMVILGQDSGPKAGWFLSSLDKNWLIKRLRLKA